MVKVHHLKFVGRSVKVRELFQHVTRWIWICFILINLLAGANRVVGLNIEGCRRRESNRYGWIYRFRCDGSTGPPCIVKRGDTVNITFDFKTVGRLSDMFTCAFVPSILLIPIWNFINALDEYSKVIQDVFWVTGFGMELPWAGMEKDVCKFMDCKLLEHSHQDFTYTYPIEISPFYPSVSFFLYDFWWAWIQEFLNFLGSLQFEMAHKRTEGKWWDWTDWMLQTHD